MRKWTWMIACIAAGCSLAVGAEDPLKWTELPPLPPAPGQTEQIGLAGPFAGVHNDALLVAGGAGFPGGPAAEGGKETWRDDIFVLVEKPDGSHEWLTNEAFKLPRPLAYGAAVSTKDGVVCIGGCDAKQCYKEVFLLTWDAGKREVGTKSLPSLPRPLAFLAAAAVGESVYVAGGQERPGHPEPTKGFWTLDLSKKARKKGLAWKELAPWPGPARIAPAAAAQSDGTADCFYLFLAGSGPAGQGESSAAAGPDVRRAVAPRIEAYGYNPKRGRWRRLTNGPQPATAPNAAALAGAVASGANHILVFGGTARAVLAYHTITDTWVRAGEFPAPIPLAAPVVRWGKSVVIPGGRVGPAECTPTVRQARPTSPGRFGWVNYAVVVVYLLALVGMGVYFSRRGKTTDDFFKAGGRIPWWAAGLSVFGTQLSAITFMAIPAKTFAADWRYFWGNMAIVMVAPFIILLFLPFYRRLNVTTAYEYLERRFNLPTRLLGSAMFMLFQFGRIGIVLLLPSLALAVVTGINVSVCIVMMGALCVIYTVLGGIEAVIWTDVLQVFVLLGGAALCLILIPFDVPGGWNGVNDIADSAGKFRVLDFRLDLTTATFWAILFGGFGANIISYGSDQTVIQRYLTTKDERAAAKGIWTNAILCIPASLLFFLMGTALFAFYKTNPQAMNPTIDRADAIFPWYIVTQLPVGAAGLLIAGVFAAAMSSLDSSMNSVATAFTTDFYRRFKPDAADRTCLLLARLVTLAVGLLGTLFALTMAQWKIKSLWDQFSAYIGLFGGGLGGLFLLAIFTRRAHGVGAIIGLAGSGVVQYALQKLYPLHPWFYAVTGIVSCFVIAYVASLVIPQRAKPLEGLTIHTLQAQDE